MIIMLVQQHRPRRPRSRWPSLPRLQIRDERLLGLQRREDGCPMSTRRLSPCSTDRLERSQPPNALRTDSIGTSVPHQPMGQLLLQACLFFLSGVHEMVLASPGGVAPSELLQSIPGPDVQLTIAVGHCLLLGRLGPLKRENVQLRHCRYPPTSVFFWLEWQMDVAPTRADL